MFDLVLLDGFEGSLSYVVVEMSCDHSCEAHLLNSFYRVIRVVSDTWK